MKAGSYTDFSASLHRQAMARRIPLSGAIELTHRCNLACAHCYNNLALSDASAHAAELTLAEYQRIFGELAEAGTLWLLFTGGEVFARPDFLDIYDSAHRAGFLITLFTNATLLTPAKADRLADRPPFAIEVSILGRTRETYEGFARAAGSFERSVEGIGLLRERGLPLTLKTVATGQNVDEVHALRRFAEEELGVPFRFDAHVSPRLDHTMPSCAVLTPEQRVALDLSDPRRPAEWRRFSGRFAAQPKQETLYQCGGGIDSFAIDPYGKLRLCVMSQEDAVDLRQTPFADAWKGAMLEVRGRKVTRATKCLECQLKAMCGQCPAEAELASSDPEQPVEELCEVAHLRASAFGIDVPSHGPCDYCPGGTKHAGLLAARERLLAGSAQMPEAQATASAEGRSCAHACEACGGRP